MRDVALAQYDHYVVDCGRVPSVCLDVPRWQQKIEFSNLYIYISLYLSIYLSVDRSIYLSNLI